MSSEDDGGIRSDYALWKEFNEHPCWKRYAELVKDHIGDRDKQLRVPVTELVHIVQGEFIKGQLAMADFLFNVPALELERLELEIERLNKEQENATGSTEHSSTGDDTVTPIDPGNDAFGT